MLKFDHSKRMTASQCLKHEFFKNATVPKDIMTTNAQLATLTVSPTIEAVSKDIGIKVKKGSSEDARRVQDDLD